MIIFDELGKIYNEIDDAYAIREAEARVKGYRRKEAEYSRNRQLNDQSYFLFMFSRLEDRVRELSGNLMDRKVSDLSTWKFKRTWEILNRRRSNISLMERVALLTKVNGSDYQLIHRYYNQRNDIAHGGEFNFPIDIPVVIIDMKRLYRVLKG